MRRTHLLALPLAVLAFCPVAGGTTPPPVDNIGNEHRQVIANATGIASDDIALLQGRRVDLPRLDRHFVQYKILNMETGELRRVSVDRDVPAVVDGRALIKQEKAAVAAANGWLPPALLRAVEAVEQGPDPAAVMLPVTMKLRVPTPEGAPRRRAPRDPADRNLVQEREDAIEGLSSIEKDTDAKFRQLLGPDVPLRFRINGPFITTSLPVDVIRRLGRLRGQQNPDLLYIDYEPPFDIPLTTLPLALPILDALPATGTDAVHAEGVTGGGVVLGVLESREVLGEVDLEPFSIQDDWSGVLDNPADPWHLTMVLGMVRNDRTGAWQGYATDATVVVGNLRPESGENNYKDRYDWAQDEMEMVYESGELEGDMSLIISMSWKLEDEQTYDELSSRDVYFDWRASQWPWPTVFTAAGNTADGYALGRGYNILSVGDVYVFTDRCATMINDDSSSTSSKQFVGFEDRALPEISAPGSSHTLLTTTFGMTSAATPTAASIAALLMSDQEYLKQWPEGIRAILMGTANDRPIFDAAPEARSEQHSAGLVSATAALECARTWVTGDEPHATGHFMGEMDPSAFVDGRYATTWRIAAAEPGTRIRVALAWNSATEETASALESDLELLVTDDTGIPVLNEEGTMSDSYSASFDNSYEIVEFRPGKSGEYLITIRDDQKQSSAVPYGGWFAVAWTTDMTPCGDYVETIAARIDPARPQDPVLQRLAALVGWQPREVEIVDWRPRPSAFLDPSFEIYKLRNLRTGASRKLVVNARERGVREVREVREADLRRQERTAADALARLEGPLRERLVREPERESMRVNVRFDVASVLPPGRDPAGAWADPRVRERYLVALRDDLEMRGIRVPLELDPDRPVVRLRLAPHDVVELASSDLIATIGPVW